MLRCVSLLRADPVTCCAASDRTRQGKGPVLSSEALL